MASTQYDVSERIRKLFEIKQQQRKAAKQYYQKLVYNPHRPIEDGLPFDPVLQRYCAMSAHHIDYFKPCAKNMLTAAFVIYIPIFLLYKCAQWNQDKKEKLLRSGEVAYENRVFKVLF